MTKYLDPSFSVCVGGDATYRENWDRIFAKKPEPELRTTPAGEPGEAGTSLPNASVTRSAICGALIGPEGEHCCVPAPCPEHQIPRAGPTPCVDPYAECSLCGTFHYNRNVRKCEDRTWNHTFTTRRVDLIDSAIAKIAALPEAQATPSSGVDWREVRRLLQLGSSFAGQAWEANPHVREACERYQLSVDAMLSSAQFTCKSDSICPKCNTADCGWEADGPGRCSEKERIAEAIQAHEPKQ